MKENKKIREGVVVSNSMDKTVKINITKRLPHPLYGKVIKTRLTLKAHDEKNECSTGDKVRVVESSPISKTKRWRVIEILERTETAED